MNNKWKVLFICLEYCDPIFSGNGVYARSIVKNLIGHVHDGPRRGSEDAGDDQERNAQVMVICGCPEGQFMSSNSTNDNEDGVQVETVLKVAVPVWYKLDRSSSWKEFGLGVKKYAHNVKQFAPDIVLAVDWTSALGLQTLRTCDVLVDTPSIYLNFRVFYESTNISEDDKRFYKEKELLALQLSQESVALCTYDAESLEKLLHQKLGEKMDPKKEVFVLNPPLRPEMRDMAQRQVQGTLNMARQLVLHNHHQYTICSFGPAKTDKGSKKRRRKFEQGNRSHSFGNETEIENGDGVKNGHHDVQGEQQHEDLAGLGLLGLVDQGDEELNGSKKGSPRSPMGRSQSFGSSDKIVSTIPRTNSFSSNFECVDDLVQHGFGGPRPVLLSYLKSQKYGGLGHVGYSDQRKYITCCCRICPEKNVQHFVQVMVQLSEFLKANQFIPCLVGPPTDDEFANDLYRILDKTFPGNSSKVIPRFVSPQELTNIFSETILNFHPALYEAYGMTIVEAAAFGTATLVHGEGRIGALDRLSAPDKIILANMTNVKQTAAVVRSLLKKPDMVCCIGQAASNAALGWSDAEFRNRLYDIMTVVVQNRFKSYSLNVERKRLNKFHSAPIKSSSMMLPPSPDSWLWIEILEWVVTTNTVSTSSSDNKVVDVDLSVVENIALSIARLPLYELAKRIETEWQHLVQLELDKLALLSHYEKSEATPVSSLRAKARVTTKEKLEKARRSEQTGWGRFFINQERFPSVSQARYHLVPSRVPEVAFWHCFFSLIKKSLSLHLDNNPFNTLQELAESFGAWSVRLLARKYDENNTQQQQQGDDDSALWENESNLFQLAKTLCHVDRKRFILVTGYPAVQGNPITPQKTDGPLAVTLLGYALHNLDKSNRIQILTERVNSFPVQACMGVFFPAKNFHHGVTGLASEQTFYDPDRAVSVESFPAGERGFGDSQRSRLREIADVAQNQEDTHICFVERVGPNRVGEYHDGVNGAPLDRKFIAPLHQVFYDNIEQYGTSALISANPAAIGMGSEAIKQLVETHIPLGEQIVSSLGCQHVAIGSQATLVSFALTAAMALIVTDNDPPNQNKHVLDMFMGTETQIKNALQAIVASGSWDLQTTKRTHSINQTPFDEIIQVYHEMKSIVLAHWESSKFK